MRTNFFKFLIIISIVSVFSSCLWDDQEVDLSSDPSFVSLVFEKNDSIPGLDGAKFTLEGDSLIVNLDSLPFQTRIDSVFPAFSFKSSAGQYLVMRDTIGTGLDTVALTGNDTIDFNRVLKVVNFAADGKTQKYYYVKVNVHQVEPELYVWSRKVNQIYNHSSTVQKAVFFKNKFFFYISSEGSNYLYTSTNAGNWNSESISGLPDNDCNFRNIAAFKDKLYFVHQNGNVYSSADGYNWVTLNPGVSGYTIVNLLFELDNQLWSVFRNQTTLKCYFGTSTDGASWTINAMIPNDFPVKDYAAHSFRSRSNMTKALVLSGRDPHGKLLSSVWSVQKNVFNEYKWVNFAEDNQSLDTMAGASIISYDDKLLLFGGFKDGNDNLADTTYWESIDEGLSWRRADTIYNVIQDLSLPLSYQSRSYQSVIHDPNSHNIYLIGGRTKDKTFSDVWVGKLNRLSFLR